MAVYIILNVCSLRRDILIGVAPADGNPHSDSMKLARRIPFLSKLSSFTQAWDRQSALTITAQRQRIWPTETELSPAEYERWYLSTAQVTTTDEGARLFSYF